VCTGGVRGSGVAGGEGQAGACTWDTRGYTWQAANIRRPTARRSIVSRLDIASSLDIVSSLAQYGHLRPRRSGRSGCGGPTYKL
jgi:hypothetical protein